MPAAIDTLKFSKRLEAAGMAPAQAEAIAEAVSEGMAEGLATKADISEAVAAMRSEMAKMEARIIRWNIGTIIAMTAVNTAVVKLL
jgi:translation initiation factor IF-2